MNVTELARILKITPQELRDKLPQLGFSIGQRAIKVNRNVANKIINDWPTLKKKIAEMKQAASIKEEGEKEQKAEEKKTIKIPQFITVRDFSQVSGEPINIILAELMKNGIFSSMNERIDFETAWLVGSELGLDIKQEKSDKQEQTGENKLKIAINREDKKDLLPRPPVIVVMGHVDHGKTKLLDAIRRTNVIDGEAGGITQHIGAYQVKRNDQLITFIDTPGHEAFTAMRSRGARIADIAILVVAADDGVKPQTVEAYRIIEAAKIPFVVAINKIDKPEANVDKTKQELSSRLNIIPEDWGGKTVCVPISAKVGTGINDLLDMVLLLVESENKNIIANPDAQAIGTIIESNIDRGAGPIATMLIQNGTIKIGDELTLNGMTIGKVRSLNNYRGEKIQSATPSTPVQIIGLKVLPQVGDILEVGQGERVKSKRVKNITKQPSIIKSDTNEEEDKKVKKIILIIKSDVLGSAEAIEESLEKINTKTVKIKIVRKGLGNITDGDIKRAEAAGGVIIGFNVKCTPTIEELAREKNIEIKIYHIIYDLINDIKEQISELTEPEISRVDLGKLKIIALFRKEKDSQIIGGKVIEGKIESGSRTEVFRDNVLIEKGEITRLQSGKQDVKNCETGEECGAQHIGKPVIIEGDILKVYREEKTTKK